MEKPRRPIAVTSRGSSRRRAMTRARSGRLSGLTLVVALLEHARDEGTTHPVVVHEQHAHVRGRRARHRRASQRRHSIAKKQPPTRASMAPRRATPRSLRSLPERRTSPGARPVPYSTVRSRRSEQYRPPRAGRLSAARVCEVHKRKFTAKSVSAHSPPVRRFFSSARRPNRQTWHNPLAESRFSVSGFDTRRISTGFVWTPKLRFLDSTFFFPNSPRGWAGRRLRNQTGDPMWHSDVRGDAIG